MDRERVLLPGGARGSYVLSVVSRRADGERGAYAILFAILIVVLFIMVSLAVDLSDARARVRDNVTRADSAAVAAGLQLAADPIGACNSAWRFIRANTPGFPLGAVSPCTSGVDENFQTRYNGGAGCDPSAPIYYRSTNSAPYEVIFIYPVTDALLLQYSGADRQLDSTFDGGEPCSRFAVQIVSRQRTLFGAISGVFQQEAPATAIVRSTFGGPPRNAAALLLLDHTGCNALVNSGQGAVYVFAHDGENPGRIAVDSDARKNGNPNTCANPGQNGPYALDVSGGNVSSQIKACGNRFIVGEPTRCDVGGIIQSFAFRPGQMTCLVATSNQACDPSDLASGQLYPVPVRAQQRTTRAPADHEWNCRGSYPNYAPYGGTGIRIPRCPDTGVRPAYIDQLRSAIGATSTTIPTGFSNYNTWYGANVGSGPGFDPCSPRPGVVVPNGNWWVNCTGSQGFTINLGAGERFEFSGGNIVFQGNLRLLGGELRINTSNATANTSLSCRRNNALCPLEHSARAAYVFLRGSAQFSRGSQGTLTMPHTAVYIHDGKIDLTGGSGTDRITWTAPRQIDSPTAGDAPSPFDKMALWSEGSSTSCTGGQLCHEIGGQGNLDVHGVFFMPLSVFNYSGQADQYLDRAQFIATRMTVTGQGILRMQPNPEYTLLVPSPTAWLIR